MVSLEKTPPGRRPPLPLPETQPRTRSAAGVLDRVLRGEADESFVAAHSGGEARAPRRNPATAVKRDGREPSWFAAVLRGLMADRAWDVPAAGGTRRRAKEGPSSRSSVGSPAIAFLDDTYVRPVTRLSSANAPAQPLRISRRTVERYVKYQIEKPRPEFLGQEADAPRRYGGGAWVTCHGSSSRGREFCGARENGPAW